MAEKKLSKKALNKSFRNWAYGNLTCFSQEHMQTFGYLCAMLPLVEELYDTKEEQKEALTTYSSFFNTEPQLGGSLVVGVTAGLEEARANGEEVDGDLINGIRAGLMGPLAGIGDSIVVGTLIPLLLGIALSMSTNGSPLGAVFYIVAWNLISVLGMRFLYYKGYNLGEKAVAVTAVSCSFPVRELNEAKAFCERENIRQFICESEELDIDGFSKNPKNRCYLCKKELFSKILDIIHKNGISHWTANRRLP